jgi:hypothetical protein
MLDFSVNLVESMFNQSPVITQQHEAFMPHNKSLQSQLLAIVNVYPSLHGPCWSFHPMATINAMLWPMLMIQA